MRFIVAIVLFVIALASTGVGIAQRTIWRGPDSFTAAATTSGTAVTVIDSAALNALPGTQTITVAGSPEIFLAYGRSTDVTGWIGDTTYTEIGWDATTQALTTTTVPGAARTVPAPAGSDLWNQEFSGQGSMTRQLNAPTGISAIVVSDGTQPAPPSISLRWPIDNSTPFATPLVVGGIVALFLGLIAFIWALLHTRRRRGPRRKLPRAPRPPRLRRGGGSGRGGRRGITAGAGLLIVAGLLAGCTPGAPSPTPTPTLTSTDAPIPDLPPVAVTTQQASRIVDRVRQTVASADQAHDPSVASTRLSGPALALRVANYTAHGNDSGIGTLPGIPDGTVQVVLPQQTSTWPRSFVAIVSPTDTTIAPIAMLMEQNSAREEYLAHSIVSFDANVQLPPVAPPQVGSLLNGPDNKLGALPPGQLATAYGDILRQDTAAPNYGLFQAQGDTLRTQIGKAAKDKRAASIPSSAKIVFSGVADPEPPVSYATKDSGQLVFTTLDDIETVTPTEAGAAINPQGEVKALSGLTQTTKGVISTYGVQLMFYVPPKTDASAQIQLLGYAQGLISAKEAP